MAFWAFGFGYLISSLTQVFVTERRMKKSMGNVGLRSIALGTFFGFLSSSCSFAALSTTRALFSKGAGLIPSLAFLLASTNLVIELGFVISIFLEWQFVVGEYVGGLLLIVFMSILVKISLSEKLEKSARHKAKSSTKTTESSSTDWKKLIQSKEGWIDVSRKYMMEWKMVWKDVSIGFTVAGIIATFVPQTFFESLFVGSASPHPAFYEILLQSLIGPVAAFFTFIGSMGNIPLAAVLFSNRVSFAGVIAFIFSDLVVFPVLRIQAKYYGWKMALFILTIFLIIIVLSSLILHYGFELLDILPKPDLSKKITDRDFFELNYTFYLNLLFGALSGFSLFHALIESKSQSGHKSKKTGEKVLFWIAIAAFSWLGIGFGLQWVV